MENRERRRDERQRTNSTGTIALGNETVTCRLIDVSTGGAQVRIDGRRASRNLMGKRVELTTRLSDAQTSEGTIVWVRPAVNGVYLGLALD